MCGRLLSGNRWDAGNAGGDKGVTVIMQKGFLKELIFYKSQVAIPTKTSSVLDSVQ